MGRALRLLVLLTALHYGDATQGFAQDSQWVVWDLKTQPVSRTEIILTITANLAPGWHIYSQRLSDDGPLPTRIIFDEKDSYLPIGETDELGNKTRFYSDIYETYIEWFTGMVSFRQKFRIHEPVTTIRGKIEYMTCNDDTCVPARREFAIEVNLLKPRQ